MSTHRSQSLTTVFWLGIGLLLMANASTLQQVDLATAVGAIAIGAASLYPLYLWCAGQVQGFPVFPFFTLTYLWTFALPLLSQNPNVTQYAPAAHLTAALTTVLFLGCGTVVWLQWVKTTQPVPRSYRALQTSQAESFFIGLIGAGALLNMYILGGWSGIPDRLFTIVRGAILGFTFLGCFIVAYRSGARQLTPFKQQLFVLCLSLNILTAAASLVLKTALTLFFISIVAFVVGGRRLPVVALLVGLLLLLPLHSGKHEMRAKYWQAETSHYIQPWDYPAWFQEWIGYALAALGQQPARYEPPKEEKESFVERSSIIHMLMQAQAKIPQQYPYVGGQTYAIIPQLLIPRALSPNKIRSHEGTHMLNIHIHRQTYEDTLRTTIAWGLLPEAYANFGLVGCAGVGALLGAFYGWVTRSAIGTPSFSGRSLFCVLVLSLAIAATEWTAGVYAASLFQAAMPLLGLNLVLMKTYRTSPRKRRTS